VDSLEKVIEKLATTEKTTIAIAREEGGKIRVTSGSWDGEKVILVGLAHVVVVGLDKKALDVIREQT
jgi:hypothetical protein